MGLGIGTGIVGVFPLEGPCEGRRGVAGDRAAVDLDELVPLARIPDVVDDPTTRSSLAFSRGASPVDLPLVPLVTLRVSLTARLCPSDEPPLWKTFQPHSSATPGEQKSRALHPAPIPSTAWRGSSSLRKRSQFA